MAKTTERDLFETLRARGLRKSAAENLAKAFGKADNSPPGKGARRAVSELRDLVSDLESRAGIRGDSKKRSAAAKKAAATRKRKANQRSTAAKKAAQTRAKSSSSRTTSSRRSTRSKAKAR